MSNTSENNKRIAKNTLLLYFRMLFTMAVSLYTSRVVLNTLGVEDFGIYNVVGGVVAMMGILNGAMVVSTQRFLTFELGKKDYLQLNRTFSACLFIYIGLCLILLFLGETLGLWLLEKKLVIPLERQNAAFWVYQFSIISCIISLISAPYNASIISHEKMSVYAYISIIEVSLKLAIVYILVIFSYDKLFLYGLLMFIVTFITTSIYIAYCTRRYTECKPIIVKDKALYSTLISYSGWNLFGSVSGLAKNQGIDIFLNMFFGPVVNASKAISSQVNSAINQFFTNFYTAVRPQITKYYAENNMVAMHNLILKSSSYSFYLLLFLSLPILLETSFIINLWLKKLPEYVVIFTRLVIINSIIDAMSTPLMTACHATGKIKLYQSLVGLLNICNLPIAYILLKLGYQPESTLYSIIFISFISLYIRLYIVNRLINLSIKTFFKQVLYNAFLVVIISSIIPTLFYFMLPDNWWRFLIVCISSCFCVVLTIYTVGISHNERKQINNYVHLKLRKI